MKHQHSHANDLFRLQAELIDAKVEKAVNQAIERVINQLIDVKADIKRDILHLKDEMNGRFSVIDGRLATLDNRLVAVETKLGMVSETRRKIRSNFIDYCFKVIMTASNGILLWVAAHAHLFHV